MPQFQAIIVTATPNGRGEDNYEISHRHDLAIEADDEATARAEFNIRAQAEQVARRAQTGAKVLSRYLFVPAPTSSE